MIWEGKYDFGEIKGKKDLVVFDPLRGNEPGRHRSLGPHINAEMTGFGCQGGFCG